MMHLDQTTKASSDPTCSHQWLILRFRCDTRLLGRVKTFDACFGRWPGGIVRRSIKLLDLQMQLRESRTRQSQNILHSYKRLWSFMCRTTFSDTDWWDLRSVRFASGTQLQLVQLRLVYGVDRQLSATLSWLLGSHVRGLKSECHWQFCWQAACKLASLCPQHQPFMVGHTDCVMTIPAVQWPCFDSA